MQSPPDNSQQRASELVFMKRILLSALCAVIGLAISTAKVRADGDWGGGTNGWQGTACTNGNGDWTETGGTNEDNGAQGGQIEGSETLIASVALTPATNAPSGAGGVANLLSD